MFAFLEDRSNPIYLLILCTSISAATFFYLNPLHRDQVTETKSAVAEELVSTILANQQSTLPYLGRKISIGPTLELINDPENVPSMPISSSCIILYIDDNSCTICSDEESAFANELVAVYGPNKVMAIVHT